jgi:hypothetical protein
MDAQARRMWIPRSVVFALVGILTLVGFIVRARINHVNSLAAKEQKEQILSDACSQNGLDHNQLFGYVGKHLKKWTFEENDQLVKEVVARCGSNFIAGSSGSGEPAPLGPPTDDTKEAEHFSQYLAEGFKSTSWYPTIGHISYSSFDTLEIDVDDPSAAPEVCAATGAYVYSTSNKDRDIENIWISDSSGRVIMKRSGFDDTYHFT